MAEQHSTPSSHAAATKARKDKECPFCHQIFTSSSLGRHLDLYIKPSNPKPADGVHDVHEIRRIRSTITRRQVKPTKKGGSKSNEESPVTEEPRATTWLNHPTWTATGVIPGLPPRSRSASRQQLRKVDVDQRQKMSDELDHLKAAEYALKELLASIKQNPNPAASDFDPLTLNFPSLCLRLLPAPSTLFSLTPFATNDTCSISPPGQKQFEALNRIVKERFKKKKTATSAATPSKSPTLMEPDSQKLLSHIADTFQHWKGLPEKQKQEAWSLEIMRSFARAEEGRKNAVAALDRARGELEAMSKQVEESTNWNGVGVPPVLSPDFILKMTPGTLGVNELGSIGQGWDYDRLVNKWKTVIQENRKAAKGLAAQRGLSVSTNLPNLVSRSLAANSMSAPASAIQSFPSHNFSGTASSASGSGNSSEDDAMGEDERDDGMDIEHDQLETPASAQHLAPKPQLNMPRPQQHQIQRSLSAQWATPTPHQSMTHHPLSNQPSPVAVSMNQAMPTQFPSHNQHPNQQHLMANHGPAMGHGGQDQSHLNLGDPHQGVQSLGSSLPMNGMDVPPNGFLSRMDMPLDSKQEPYMV